MFDLDGYLNDLISKCRTRFGDRLLYRNLTKIALSLTVFMFPASSDGAESDDDWLKLWLIMQEAVGLLPCTHPAAALRKPLIFTRQWASD